MAETTRLLEAAAALSQLLTSRDIPHAFHGSLVTAVLAKSPQCSETLCIVEGTANAHPFGRVRQAVDGAESLIITNSPWTNRLFVTYNVPIPPITIEILPAGEDGPRRLDESTVANIQGIPFLTVSEFLRAKLKAWSTRDLEHDAQDIVWTINRYWQSVDINRIPEDIDRFIVRYPAAATAWAAIKTRYGL